MQAQLLYGETKSIKFTPVAACLAGDVVQLPGGLAGVCVNDIPAGELGAAYIDGIFKLTKTASIALLIGGDLYFDVSTGKGNFKADLASTDFKFGTVHSDSVAADTYCYGRLNGLTNYSIDLGDGGPWVAEELAAGVAGSVDGYPGGGGKIVISNGNEVQSNCLRSVRTVLVSAKPIFEAIVTRATTTDAAVDMDFGLATGGHASDFESVADFAAFHMDGDDSNIDTHSDDGGTDRAPADSTIDHVEGTFAEYWIDARDDTNVKFYVDGILVDTSASKRILTAALARGVAALIMIEKTTGTATSGATATRMRVRTQAE